VSGFMELTDRAQEGVQQIQAWLEDGPLQVGGEQMAEAIDQGVSWLQSNVGMFTSGAITGAVTAGNIAIGLIMALFAMFFFLSDGDRMWSWVVRLAPREIRTPVHEAGRRGWVTLSSYVKTQVIVAAVDGIFIALGAHLLDVPLAVPIGLIVFFAAAIPIVGAVVSGALAVLVALVAVDFVTALLMLLVVIAVQQIESNLLQPILMSKAVALHPLATLLGVAVGSYTFGIVGALFAVPVMAVTNTVVLYLNGHDKFPMLTQDASVLTNSAKELTGDKHAPKHDDAPPAPGSDAPRIGDADPHRYTEQQEAYDEHMEQRAEVERVEDGQIKGPDHEALQENKDTRRHPDQGGGARPADD
ncbi:MAG: AI-2E family transporter, partial [Mobilicoccus sp.]|nr:AI-2E family transporter [Mobilicoccus sp.]